MEKRTKKDEYNESIIDKRTYINGETAMKPYFYLRNGVLHVRYTVDRCIRLSRAEETKLKIELSVSDKSKQEILERVWNVLTVCNEREVILDGIAELEKKIKEIQKNGYKNKSSDVQ